MAITAKPTREWPRVPIPTSESYDPGDRVRPGTCLHCGFVHGSMVDCITFLRDMIGDLQIRLYAIQTRRIASARGGSGEGSPAPR